MDQLAHILLHKMSSNAYLMAMFYPENIFYNLIVVLFVSL
jgi:hypothetical protein